MSAKCAITTLREQGAFVVGCDIYPGKWHYETKLCDAFEQAPYATRPEEYIPFLIETCRKYNLNTILPLTDLEIDVLNDHRADLKDFALAMPSADVLSVARDKYALYRTFAEDAAVPSLKTILLREVRDERLEDASLQVGCPCIAKPYNGRSSEGLIRNAMPKDIEAITHPDAYILQEQKAGTICTVDYVRSPLTGRDAMVAREELLRTKNGAGMTVRIFADDKLHNLVHHIGETLGIGSTVNMEFIHAEDGQYYLIDINPRFSAGVAYSRLAGFDMVSNHFRALAGEDVDALGAVEEMYITKHWVEEIL